MNKALITNIQKYSIHDGEGVRTTVFLKGCPLHCYWCANPENQNFNRQIMYFPNKCMSCFECVKVCPNKALSINENGALAYHKENCVLCGACERECLKDAIRVSGKEYTPEQIVEIGLKDAAFYNSGGGGITISGGEPLSFEPFCLELLDLCEFNRLGVIFETCGYGKAETLLAYAKKAQGIFFDVKHYDPEKHKQATGVSNEVILQNLRQLTDVYPNAMVRIPVIYGLNNSEEDMAGIADVLKKTVGKQGIQYVELLPFHNLGALKYEALGWKNVLKSYQNMDKSEPKKYIPLFEKQGFRCLVK